MDGENEFWLKVGKPGNKGAASAKRYGARVRKAAARMVKRSGKANYTGRMVGVGSAAGRMAAFRDQPFARHRMRRVIVKLHIARANKGIGPTAYRAHLKYIQRDGVERDGSGGELYDRDGEKLDDQKFLERSEKDRHQFRLVLSPEDGDQLADLKSNTRAFMARVEQDLGTKLDWVAVDHHNTGHPHTHIVIRGKDELGKDLVIAPDYIKHGFRSRAQELVMEQLGPRTDLEIARAQSREVMQERFTSIDRGIAAQAIDNHVVIDKADSIHGRFTRSLKLQRLKQLEMMELATSAGPGAWTLKDGWGDTLKTMGRRGDIVRSIAAAMGEAQKAKDIKIFNGRDEAQKPVIGRLAADGPGDEMRDTRFLVIDGVDGKRWHVDIGKHEIGSVPPSGAVVEVSAKPPSPRKADRTIAEIASRNDGVYSDTQHQLSDPSSSQSYRDAHKRRLEAMRRAGFAERLSDGSWRVGQDHLEQASAYEKTRGGGASFKVKSWIKIESQQERHAPTWLDQIDENDVGKKGFGKDVTAARRTRVEFLKREGLWNEKANSPDKPRMKALTVRELHATGTKIAGQTASTYVPVDEGMSYSGIYQRPVNLAQGRFAMVGQAKEFTLVPWRKEMERQRGKMINVKRTRSGVSWTFGKAKGIGR